MNKIKLGKKTIFPFTIPSGIITTEPPAIEKLARNIPELGIITTKSIGPNPRSGYCEPILHQYEPGCFVNAVGLRNPGCEAFKDKLSKINFPKDKYLLLSVMGGNAEDFCEVVKTLEDDVDGFELNLSCPHAKGYGQQIGADPKLVYEIVKAVCAITKKEVFAKLSPNVEDIAVIAESAMNAGAYGIVAINTVGPEKILANNGHPVLSNQVGGLSGRSVLPVGLLAVRHIKEKLGDIPILGMGGIFNAKDIASYKDAGATYFGIGSSLAGMDDKSLKSYFSSLTLDLENSTNNAESFLQTVDMSFTKTKVIKNEGPAPDLRIIEFDAKLDVLPGQFIFIWLPGIGEKPFSVLDNEPLTLGIQERGKCTKAINELSAGDKVFIRGPYGKGIDTLESKELVLVGGGSGIAGLYLFAKHFAKSHSIKSFLGAKDKEHIFYQDELAKFGEVLIATEDGSLGTKGFVTGLFDKVNFDANTCFINCGPKPMIDAVVEIESKHTANENILSSVDYLTMCGVGICGSCANERGLRMCVDGPFAADT